MADNQKGFALISTLMALAITIFIMTQMLNIQITQGYSEVSATMVSDLTDFSNMAKNIYIDGDYSSLSTAQMISLKAVPPELIDSNGITIHSRLGGPVAFGSTLIGGTSYFTISMDSIGQPYCSKILSNARGLFSFISLCPDKTSVGCVQVAAQGAAFDVKAVAHQCARRKLSRIIFTGK